jgi:hypothetical protein
VQKKMDSRGNQEQKYGMEEGRTGRGLGVPGYHFDQRPGGRPWDNRRGNFRGGRPQFQQWRNRDYEMHQNQHHNREQQFDLRQNLRQGREDRTQEDEKKQTQHEQEEEIRDEKGQHEAEGTGNMEKTDNLKRKEVHKDVGGTKDELGVCKRCGRVGHKSEDCLRPLICNRCKKEGHVPRACSEFVPWEHIAPFMGLLHLN